MFRIDFIQTANQNKTRLSKAFDTKRKANKFIKNLLKNNRIQKRGFDYFTTNRDLELQMNY